MRAMNRPIKIGAFLGWLITWVPARVARAVH